MKEIQTDILIIGSGIAALQCAQLLSQKFSIQLITKSNLYTSSSYRAQGGIAAVTKTSDTVQLHMEDTLAAGIYHHNEKNVQTLIQNGAHIMQTLLSQGLPIDRLKDGSPALGLEGAHSAHRIMHAGGDQTGKFIIDYFIQQLRTNITIHEQETAIELLLNTDGHCIGVRTVRDEQTTNYIAHHTILATGGAGALYEYTSNFQTNTGDGIALAWKAGTTVSDMEFMQFHPSLLFVNNESKGLVSEAVRGAGGIFVDAQRKPIMTGIHPLGDLAPRHITAHTLFQKRQNGEQTYIDISPIQNFEQRFPTITALCQTNDVNLVDGLIPIAPGSHFLMGGIVANAWGQTSIPHLYAVGEVACTGVHGANRLASNSLLEGITFGYQLAEHLLTKSSPQKNFNQQLQHITEAPALLEKATLKHWMNKALGIIRTKQTMQQFKQLLPSLHSLRTCTATSPVQAELLNMHIVARLMVEAALTRTESRGAHIREDYTETDPTWAQQWIIFNKQQMKVRNCLYEQHQTRKHAQTIF